MVLLISLYQVKDLMVHFYRIIICAVNNRLIIVFFVVVVVVVVVVVYFKYIDSEILNKKKTNN